MFLLTERFSNKIIVTEHIDSLIKPKTPRSLDLKINITLPIIFGEGKILEQPKWSLIIHNNLFQKRVMVHKCIKLFIIGFRIWPSNFTTVFMTILKALKLKFEFRNWLPAPWSKSVPSFVNHFLYGNGPLIN